MKNLLLLIVLLSLSSCNSQKKEEKNIIEYSCECITKTPQNKNNSELIAETQKCISNGYEKYADYVKSLANEYFEKNPNAELIDAQNWIKEIVIKDLIKKCPKYSKLVTELAFKNKNHSDVIKGVANKICEEINNLNATKLSWELIDPIFTKQSEIQDRNIREKYNLSDKTEKNKYTGALIEELMLNCPKYSVFSLSLIK